MKLDRNTNRGGRGKYALVNMRKLVPLLERQDRMHASMKKDGTWDGKDVLGSDELALVEAFELLVNRGIVSLGNESPGDQFFVMKYKDKFTADGLSAYSRSVQLFARFLRDRGADAKEHMPLFDYAREIENEAATADGIGNRITDGTCAAY